MATQAETVPHRALITVCAMVAMLMQALDGTIANVALPYMQGGLAATADQITWVLTSYITAAAILTAPVGFLVARFGRRAVFLGSVGGFTLASVLCGAAQSLEQMVVFRLLQGAFGAALVPLSQSTMLDIYPAEQRGQAMAIWGMGVMVGPILGPTLGGYLTESWNWRWVFYFNLPFGVLAFLGLMFFLPKGGAAPERRFDWLGFGVLALGVGALQVMLDRSELKNWFGSTEILIEATLAALGLYLFLVHMALAEKPFIPPRIFRDRNFAAGLGIMFAVGAILFATSALLAPYLQTLADYPVFTAGLTMAPRGLGTMAAMFLAGRLASRFDPRKVMAFGILVLAWTLWDMVHWTPDIPMHWLMMAALLTRNTQIMHASLAEHVTPLNRLFELPWVQRFWDPATAQGAAMLNAEVTRQSSIIAYSNDFYLLMLLALAMLLLLPLMRRPPRAAAADPAHAAMD
jgi:MFS transporter, DHA2 family, multidrug resistance protein